MGSIIFVEHNGTQHAVDLELGKSLMQIALDNGIPGIDADCGGECACGTCHVIIESIGTGDISVDELQMLDLTPERTDGSRLACQVITSEAMDGLVARLPEFQM